MAKHRTEAVYDDEMNPLVAKLIEIAKREGIPLFVNAGLIGPDGDPIGCEMLVSPAPDPRLSGIVNRHQLCHGIVRGHSGLDRAAALRITRFHPEERDDNAH